MARAKQVAANEPIEGLWELPEGWRWASLGQYVSKSGGSVTPANFPDEVFQVYSVPSFPSREPEKLRGSAIRSAKQKVDIDDVLLCKINPRINRVWKVRDNGTGQRIASTEWIRFASNPEVHPDYLRYFLMRDAVRNYLSMSASGVGGSLMRVRPRVLETIQFPWAPLDVQEKVVARIDQLFAEIGDGEEALELAREDLGTWRKALLKAAVTGELTADCQAKSVVKRTRAGRIDSPPSEDLPELPASWSWTTVGQIGDVTGGITKSAKRASHDRVVPYLRVANVYAGRLMLDRVESIGVSPIEFERTELREGDLLVVEGNGSIDQIGRSAVWDGSISPCIHQNHLIKVRFDWPLLSTWVQAWLQSPHGRRELEDKASSTSGLHTLSISKIKALRCPLPPELEIADALTRLKRLRDEGSSAETHLQSARSDAAALRQSILVAAFRGELA